MGKRRLTLLIGPSERVAARLRDVLDQKRDALAKSGIYAAQWNHVRLYAAAAEAQNVTMLRYRRGLDNPLVQQTLAAEFDALFRRELPGIEQPHVVWVAAQLGNLLHAPTELKRLKALLTPHFEDIRIVAHVEEQARALIQHYATAVFEGRSLPLSQELSMPGNRGWWRVALTTDAATEPFFGRFADIERPPHWIDYKALLKHWEDCFGDGNVALQPIDWRFLFGDRADEILARTLNIGNSLGKVTATRPQPPEPAAALTRMRMMNDVLTRYARAKSLIIPREFWVQMLRDVRVPGPGIAPGSLHALSKRFAKDNAALIKQFPDLASALVPDPPAPTWVEADPTLGFRPTQYLAAYAHGIEKRSMPVAEKQAELDAARQAAEKFDALLSDRNGDAGAKNLINRVKVNHQMILSTQFRPHNDVGLSDDAADTAPYTPMPPRKLPKGSSGNVIVGCMKNEAPYIIEWVAYHRAIGVDNFLIYTNDCSDGTDEVLERLQEMGVLQHRNNDNWKGNSPQQYALKQSLKEPVIRHAEWIIHIDVDEFMNIRTGNGTLNDLFAAAPDATNFAMTWRLFGHNGVTELRDDFVIEQFDTCAPKYCPKPHTVWGFKTMFRNIGAYAKISCHRPNKLNEAFETKVKWVNGSGQDMTRAAAHNGWRSSKNTIGYDLLQLNHYALRSAESFLIKRQRGRALHVDRSIGINYWIRMDWGDYKDQTIKRNIPRLRAEYDRLMQDDKLRAAHEQGLAWHRAKADELHQMPEFQELYRKALDIRLNGAERVAYALALDMES